MISALRGSSPSGKDLNMTAVRSRIFSSTKLFILAGATVMSSLVPSAAFGQAAFGQVAVAARPPLSPEAKALHLLAKRPLAFATATPELSSASESGIDSAQGFGALARDLGRPGCDLFPAPPSVGATVGLPYFGPPPSTVNPSLVGPVQLLNTGPLDAINGTITIPLYKGSVKSTGKTAWYILTDVSNKDIAEGLGLNFSEKMNNITTAARTGNLDAYGNIVFDKGTVNFAADRNVVPGPPGREFPPVSFTPGEVGDADYSPYVRIANGGGVVYNASMIAYDVDASQINFPNGHVDYSKVHDEVQAIDPYNMTVTLALVNGFSFGRPVWYISMDSSQRLVATVEHNTLAPLMGKLLLGHDDSAGSPVERIFIATNGAEGCNNPTRQGLSASLADDHRPNNTFGGIPTLALDYSPAWDANLYTWTDDAIDRGYRQQLREEFQILTYAQDGLIVGATATSKFGSAGFTINCPVVERLN